MNCLNYLFNHESILVLSLVILCILNIYINSKNEKYILLINLILIFLYFIISKRKDKNILFLALLNFSLYGFIIEKLIIYKTKVLSYRNNIIPSWLITIYAFFFITSLYTYDFYKYLLK